VDRKTSLVEPIYNLTSDHWKYSAL